MLKTPEATKYIRQAINHVIPRQKIMDELYLSGATVVTPLVRGFDNSLKPHVYNLTKVKELMEKEGYIYHLESFMTTTTTESSTPTPSLQLCLLV